MKGLPFFVIAFAMFFFFTGDGYAHKVNVFAFVDGDEIQVECRFSRSQKVKNGKLEITDLVTGDLILTGTTNAQGIFRFRPPEAFLATGHGLQIRLLAGEGHQDDWKISPEDLRALSRTGGSATAPRSTLVTPPSPPPAVEKSLSGPAVQFSGLDAAGLEAMIARVVDAKLAPLKQALAQQENREPSFRDIVGGIGWILGLLGLATYLKYRR